MTSALTKHPKASFLELLHVAGPMILSAMTGFIMVFVDRLFLSYYSLEAMNGVSVAGTSIYTFLLTPLSICSMSEVFVGQYNGSKQYTKAGLATWQMIFFALGSTLFLLPAAFYLVPLIIDPSIHQTALPYSNWYLGAGSIHCLVAALTGFFTGIGRTRLVLYATIFGNLVNVVLDPLLIFGYGPVPSLGVSGAVFATLLGELSIVGILFFFFFKKVLREKYHTLTPQFDFKIFFKSLKIGTPSALAHTIEVLGWTLLMYYLTTKGTTYLTVYVMGQSFFIFFVFFTEGLEKGVTAIASNLIGSKESALIKKVLLAAAKMHGLWMLLVSPFLLIWPEVILDIFQIDEARITHGSQIYMESLIALKAVWLFMLIDGIVWIIAGLFKAAGDTVFILFANPVCFFLFGFLPSILLIEQDLITPGQQWFFMCTYAGMNVLLFLYRYRSHKWMKLDLSKSA